MEEKITLTNQHGLHARPAATFVKEASRYDADIRIKFKDKVINAKSIVEVMSAGIDQGSEIVIEVKGEGKEEALQGMVDFVEQDLN